MPLNDVINKDDLTKMNDPSKKICTPLLSAKKDDRFIEKKSVESTRNENYFDESTDQEKKQVQNLSAKPQKYIGKFVSKGIVYSKPSI